MDRPTKTCPNCGEQVNAAARVCPHCHDAFSSIAPADSFWGRMNSTQRSNSLGCGILAIILLAIGVASSLD